VKALAARAPVVVVLDENAKTMVAHFSRLEPADASRRAADARKIVGDAAAFVGVDTKRDPAAMPPTNLVVDGAGRVVFASDDLVLVAAAAERLLAR